MFTAKEKKQLELFTQAFVTAFILVALTATAVATGEAVLGEKATAKAVAATRIYSDEGSSSND